jgi:hypothetical protein
MIYIKINGQYKTVKEIATKYNLSPKLVYNRYKKGITNLEKLIQPKYEMIRK